VGIGQLDAPVDTLLIEWSAPPGDEAPDLDIDNPRVWRACQPHWDERRLAVIAKARRDVDERTFRQQWLNMWVPSLSPPAMGADIWPRVVTQRGPRGALAFGGEVTSDHSRAVIVAYGGGIAELVEADLEGYQLGPRLLELAARHGGLVGLDASGPAAGAAEELAGALGDRLVKMTATQAAAGAGQVFDALAARPPALILRDHPAMQLAVTTSRRRRQGQAWAWDRDAAGMIMVAVTAAAWAAAHAPEEEEAEEPMVFA
jgi:hypothetical protein